MGTKIPVKFTLLTLLDLQSLPNALDWGNTFNWALLTMSENLHLLLLQLFIPCTKGIITTRSNIPEPCGAVAK